MRVFCHLQNNNKNNWRTPSSCPTLLLCMLVNRLLSKSSVDTHICRDYGGTRLTIKTPPPSLLQKIRNGNTITLHRHSSLMPSKMLRIKFSFKPLLDDLPPLLIFIQLILLFHFLNCSRNFTITPRILQTLLLKR